MYTFYCDESGNTGNNYLDLKDPFFVLGGWMIDDHFNNECLKNVLTDMELKSSKLLKSPTGRKKVQLVLRALLNEGCTPFMAIVDKKYALVARMIDVLLDPEYNNMLPTSITRDEYCIPKKDLANIFYQIDDIIVEDFAKAYKNLASKEMEKCIIHIAQNLANKGYEKLSKMTLNSINTIDKNLLDEIDCAKNQAPNVFGLYTLMHIVNIYANSKNISVNFIHDSQKEYSDSLQKMTSLMLQEREDLIRYAYKEQQAMFNKIVNFKLEDSKTDILIQCSDILVGATNYTLKKLKSEKEFDITEKEILKTLWVHIVQWDSPQTTHFMIEDGAFYLFNDTVKRLIG